MKQILSIRSVSWDLGYDTEYIGTYWDFNTMAPAEVSFGQKFPGELPVPSSTSPTLAQQCYRVYNHNQRRQTIIEVSVLQTDRSPLVGDTVRVYRGRLAPIGTVAEVIRITSTNYGDTITLRDSRLEYRTYSKNVEVLACALTRRPSDLKPAMEYPEISALELAILQGESV